MPRTRRVGTVSNDTGRYRRREPRLAALAQATAKTARGPYLRWPYPTSLWVNLGIHRRFEEAAISFAYPTQELILRRGPAETVVGEAAAATS